ncbi:MAG: hypothetical protein K6A72_10765 [Lachnospiraceae bacterium]|nr:hypothetical protein [Lachnospiraceae bacterium]
MDDILFWYPAYEDDRPLHERSDAKHKQGSIRVINTAHEPYEMTIDTDGYSFHAIFGSQINGHFLCIPNWNLGCELAAYNDKAWNISSIYRAGTLRYTDACAIGNALQLIEILLGKEA